MTGVASKLLRSSPSGNNKQNAELTNYRPSLQDRFKLHSKLMEAVKATQNTGNEIRKRENQIEKLQKKLKDSQAELE